MHIQHSASEETDCERVTHLPLCSSMAVKSARTWEAKSKVPPTANAEDCGTKDPKNFSKSFSVMFASIDLFSTQNPFILNQKIYIYIYLQTPSVPYPSTRQSGPFLSPSFAPQPKLGQSKASKTCRSRSHVCLAEASKPSTAANCWNS